MSLFEDVLCGALAVATLPVAAAVDIVTIGSDKPSVTAHNLNALGQSIDDAIEDTKNGNIFTDD